MGDQRLEQVDLAGLEVPLVLLELGPRDGGPLLVGEFSHGARQIDARACAMHGLFEQAERLALLSGEGLPCAEAMLLELHHHLPEPLEPELVQNLAGSDALLHGLAAGSAVEAGRMGGLLDRKGDAAGTTGAFGNRGKGCVHVSLLERTGSCAH